MITQKLKKYNFSACSFFDRPNSLKDGFIIRFKLSSPVTEREETEIFSIPDAVRGTVRLLTLKEAGEGWGMERKLHLISRRKRLCSRARMRNLLKYTLSSRAHRHEDRRSADTL